MDGSNELTPEGVRLLLSCEQAVLLSYVYDSARKTLRLVCECGDVALGADRAFTEFGFSGVRTFVRYPGRHPVLGGAFRSEFFLRAVQGTWVVEFAEVREVEELCVASISLGEALGSLEVVFEDLDWRTKSIYAVRGRQDPEPEYVDSSTGKRVDFYDPFS